MAAPSGGDYHRHLERQKQLVEAALDLPDGNRDRGHGHNGAVDPSLAL
jgi:hypothetical protein